MIEKGRVVCSNQPITARNNIIGDLDALENYIATLESTIRELRDCIGLVLRDDITSDTCGNEAVPTPLRSSISYRIMNIQGSVISLNYLVRDIIERSEVV